MVFFVFFVVVFSGLIVLNVRWRNKVFSGALIDVEKNKWASDRWVKIFLFGILLHELKRIRMFYLRQFSTSKNYLIFFYYFFYELFFI